MKSQQHLLAAFASAFASASLAEVARGKRVSLSSVFIRGLATEVEPNNPVGGGHFPQSHVSTGTSTHEFLWQPEARRSIAIDLRGAPLSNSDIGSHSTKRILGVASLLQSRTLLTI